MASTSDDVSFAKEDVINPRDHSFSTFGKFLERERIRGYEIPVFRKILGAYQILFQVYKNRHKEIQCDIE